MGRALIVSAGASSNEYIAARLVLSGIPLPADRYLLPYVSLTSCTEILRLRLRMTTTAERPLAHQLTSSLTKDVMICQFQPPKVPIPVLLPPILCS